MKNIQRPTPPRPQWLLVSLSLCGLLQPPAGFSQDQRGTQAVPATVPAPTVRDGQHDFDFKEGAWKTHIKRRLHPLSGSAESLELNGTLTFRKVWDGRAWLEEIEADGPKGHWEGMTLFLYNPQAHQWSQSFFNSATVDPSPPLVGSFENGRGELYSQDTLNGRSIFVRGEWSDIKPDFHRYEESYSGDGGKTWEPAFTAELTRDSSRMKEVPHTGSHDFDFDFGTWKTHTSRLKNPLTGSTTWADMDGYTVVRKVWGGKGNLAEYKADGPAGHVELLALRLYNPTTHQWSINFATPDGGTLGVPAGVGEFQNGRCTFYDQEVINGRTVMVRFSIWGITPDTAQSEQAFSADGGKTWEVNWINRYTRVKDRS